MQDYYSWALPAATAAQEQLQANGVGRGFLPLDESALGEIWKVLSEMKACPVTPAFKRSLVHVHDIVIKRLKELKAQKRPHFYFPTGFAAPIKWAMTDAAQKCDEGMLLICQMLELFGMDELNKPASKDYTHWKRRTDDVPIMLCREDIAKLVQGLRTVIEASP